MQFVQKVRRLLLVLSYLSKKIYEWIRILPKPQKLNFWVIFGHSCPSVQK